MDYSFREVGGLKYLYFPQMEKLGWVVHAFTTRGSGVSPFPAKALNLSYIEGDSEENVQLNRRRLLQALGIGHGRLVTLRQLHTDRVIVQGRETGREEPAGDSLITDQPGLILAIQVADCAPILVVDRRKRAIGAVHAGWRGTAERIVEKTWQIMRANFGTKPADCLFAIGPTIERCCYQVGKEVVTLYQRYFPTWKEFLALSSSEAGYLSLAKANVHQLLEIGVRPEQILSANLCTSCHRELFFSHRGEGGTTGRMMALVMIK